MNKLETAEGRRLAEAAARERNWQRWGPYLSERQWATVREDYSADGSNWTSFPYEQSLGRAYRWGEDGLLGITDRECRLCFAVALWNGNDPHLKERLFGLTNPEGNHSEDVKEVYFYLDATPTHSYLKALYKYPQREFPYRYLRDENKRRGRQNPEYELTDTDAFDDNRYWDVIAEYAKASPDDILVRLTIANRGPVEAILHLLPTLWFRNTWTWGSAYDEGRWAKPRIARMNGGLLADHETLGRFRLTADPAPRYWAFTENETNPRVFEQSVLASADWAIESGRGAHCKDAFHRLVVNGDRAAVQWDAGTKAAGVYELAFPAGGEAVVRLRLTADSEAPAKSFSDFDRVFADRVREADEFYAAKIPAGIPPATAAVSRQAYAGLLWSEQFYHYVIPDWVNGDKNLPTPPAVRDHRINRDWPHLFCQGCIERARQVGVPGFFRLGHRLPRRTSSPRRPGICQAATRSALARVVFASERATSGVRVRPIER